MSWSTEWDRQRSCRPPTTPGPVRRLPRAEARAQGQKSYTAVVRCSRDHEPLRRVHDGKCLGCLEEHRQTLARAVAREVASAKARLRREVEREHAAVLRKKAREAARDATRNAKEAEKDAQRKALAKATRQARKAADEAGKGVGAAATVDAPAGLEAAESWPVPVDDGEPPWFT